MTTILQGIGATIIWWVLAMILLMVGYITFDKIWTKIDFNEELLKGNIAVGVMVAGFFIALGLVIAAAMS